MLKATNYTEQFLEISTKIGVHVNDPSTYIRLNWNLFNGIREEFKLNLPELKALVSAAQDNVLNPQYHSAFTILQAGKILTIEQALGEGQCGANYEIALSFRDVVPVYFCEIVGHNTCILESKILNNFAALESKCVSVLPYVPITSSADMVMIDRAIMGIVPQPVAPIEMVGESDQEVDL